MARSKRIILTALLAVLLAALPLPARCDDTGLIVGAGVEHKFSRKLSVEGGVEMRTRNDFRTMDRWTVELGAEYKLLRPLKIGAGYSLLVDNNPEKLSYNLNGSYNNWRPSYWGTRHRVHVDLTGSYSPGRFKLSLRERWQYTWRPEHTTDRYDFDNAHWEDTRVHGKGKNVLRSRFKVDYDIAGCKVDPTASVELFNAWSLEKVRLQAGVNYTIRKTHSFELFYRYQHVRNDSDDESNIHMIGLEYKFKF